MRRWCTHGHESLYFHLAPTGGEGAGEGAFPTIALTCFDAAPEKKDSWGCEWGRLKTTKYGCVVQGTILRKAGWIEWIFSDSSGNHVGN